MCLAGIKFITIFLNIVVRAINIYDMHGDPFTIIGYVMTV